MSRNFWIGFGSVMCGPVEVQLRDRNNPDTSHFELFYDPKGNVVATEGLVLISPWSVKSSTKYEGRYFFFNADTAESAWSLPPNDCYFPRLKKDDEATTEDEPIEPIPPTPRETTPVEQVENGSILPSILSPTGGSWSISSGSFFNQRSNRSVASFPDLSTTAQEEQRDLKLLNPGEFDIEAPKQQQSGTIRRSPTRSLPRPKFSVIEGLGRGGYATVVKVVNSSNQKVYAMKAILKSNSPNVEKRQIHQDELEGELKFMTQIAPSPFLQRCHYAFENPFAVYFILDLHTGGDLYFHLLKKCSLGRGFNEKESRVLLAELYLAVEHLHKHNIVHRDIKVENVMLDSQGHVKLVDYGLAVQIQYQTQPMKSLGSLIYMAPELLFEKTGGRHIDWWSYGILAHELLTGNSPWSSLTNSKVIKKEIKTGLINPQNISQPSKDFVLSLLNRDVPSRLGTIEDREIKESPFFKKVNWEKTTQLLSSPAFKPPSENVSLEDQDEALETYFDLTRTANQADTSSLYEPWFLGLENANHFLEYDL